MQSSSLQGFKCFLFTPLEAGEVMASCEAQLLRQKIISGPFTVAPKLKAESEGILQDIRRIEKAVVVEDQFLNRKDIGLLDKALARRDQQKLVKHKRNLENRLNRRQQIINGKGLPLDVTPDDELSDGGYSSVKEFKDRETLPHRYRIKRSRFRENYPSLFDYPNEIPKHHTVDRLVTVEQEELNKRIIKKSKKPKLKVNQRKKKVVNKSHHNYQ